MEAISKFLASQDQFGPSISMNFRGSERWQTTRGGLITIIMLIVFMWQSSLLVIKFVRQDDSEISTYSLIEGDDREMFLLEQRQFISFAVFEPVEDYGLQEIQVDPRAGKFQIFHFYISNTAEISSLTEIPIIDCDFNNVIETFDLNDSSMNFLSQTEVRDSKARCIDTQSKPLSGI